MGNDPQRHHLLFEFFKHMSTLGAAALAAVVAVGQAIDLGLGLTVTGLLGFGWSLIASVFGMIRMMGVSGEDVSGVKWLFVLVRWLAVGRMPESEAADYPWQAAIVCGFAFLFTFLVVTGALLFIHVAGFLNAGK